VKPSLRRTVLAICFGAFLFLGAASIGTAQQEHGSAAAETQSESSEQQHELYIKIINFVILVGGLSYLLRRPIGQFFSQRSTDIRRGLEEGKKALEASQVQLAAVEDKLSHLEEEIAAFKAAAEREMESERQRLRREAAVDAEKLLETARVRLDAATRAARQELRISTARAALEHAEQMIRARLDPPARERLVSQFVSSLPRPERRN
jgi:F-type H+-transporting ATPase subunit b